MQIHINPNIALLITSEHKRTKVIYLYTVEANNNFDLLFVEGLLS
jgi:hypothetical protein